MRTIKKKNGKEKTSTQKLMVEEPEAVYYTSPKNKLWVAGANKESNQESYIKRSLALMGMEAVKPFSEVENVSDFISCIPKQKLNAEQSERVIELAKLYSRGEEVFDSLDAFKEWMDNRIMALGNKKPKEFLDTSLGIEMLMNELGRIEQGIFA